MGGKGVLNKKKNKITGEKGSPFDFPREKRGLKRRQGNRVYARGPCLMRKVPAL